MNVFYSVCGEGLGHATRLQSVIEEFHNRKIKCNFHIFTFGDAFDFLRHQYKNVNLIHGLSFGHNVSYLRNLWSLPHVLEKSRKAIFEHISRNKPDLCITDFEPSLAYVAKQCGIPCISLDNQHKFSRCNHEELPFSLQCYAKVAGIFIENYIPDPTHVIISTFYHQANRKDTTYVGTMMRREYISKQGKFVLVYYKPHLEPALKFLAKNNIKAKVYGTNKYFGTSVGNFALDPSNFLYDLSACSHVICSAGNQTIGEAIYFGKPVLAIPQQRQYEQYINAHYVYLNNKGNYCYVEKLSDKVIGLFLDNYKCSPVKGENGTVKAVSKILEIYEST